MKINVNSEEFAKGCDVVSVLMTTAAQSAMKEACTNIATAAKDRCKLYSRNGSGELANSITYKITASGAKTFGTVGSDNNHAVYFHEGTGIHARRGNGRKEVPWTYFDDRIGGYVQTSGLEPHPFLEEAVNEQSQGIAELFRKVFTR